MRYIGQLYGQAKTPGERQTLRAQVTDMVRVRGTVQIPPPPREVTIQSAPRGLLVTWSEPDPRNPGTKFINGWRVYKGDEKTLYDQIRDRGNRQKFVETTAGTTPPVTAIYVSSVNALGAESQTVQALGSAIAETGAPTMPSSPPEYTSTYSGGGDKTSGTGKTASTF